MQAAVYYFVYLTSPDATGRDVITYRYDTLVWNACPFGVCLMTEHLTQQKQMKPCTALLHWHKKSLFGGEKGKKNTSENN